MTLPPPNAEGPTAQLLGRFLDAAWYKTRYPDIGDLDPLDHFIRYGSAERRDPNRFFDSAWYIEHNPDVAASAFSPLVHYVRAGAAELRNPHPRFDAAWYVSQHPAAATNPLLYHLMIGSAQSYPTEKLLDIRDYLPSQIQALPPPRGVFADVIIVVQRDLDATTRCIRSVLADRSFPLARLTIIDDNVREPPLRAWLRQLADDGHINLIRSPRRLGHAAAASLGIAAAERHDVVLLSSNTQVQPGWLCRLAAHAHAQRDIATVSPLSGTVTIQGGPLAAAATPAGIDTICRAVNAGRSEQVLATPDHCRYIRHTASQAIGDPAGSDFQSRATAAGWRHLVACDTFVPAPDPGPHAPQDTIPDPAIPARFAATAALFRQTGRPVILMVSHNFGGGVRRHIDSLAERYRETAHVLVLEATGRGAALLLPGLPNEPVLTLPSDRLDDFVTVLRSAGVSRLHVHHLLNMDIDVRLLIHRLGVPFDLTVHDYYAICPQVNLLIWPEGLYCGEPGPATCDACIASQSSHGARDITSWRRDNAWQFLDAERVICPSQDVKNRLDRHGMGTRAIVVPHEQQEDPVWASRLPALSSPVLRIVLLGVMANQKGARAVAEFAELAEPGTIELYLIGYLEPSFPKAAAKLIRTTGQYDDRDLPALLAKIDPHVFWFPSSTPESYSFTLSTAIATGLPIVATDLGSFTERLTGRPHTWLVDHRASSQQWLAAFDAVRATLRNKATEPPVPRRIAISDFYTDRYLARAPVTVRTNVRPRIAIVPERYDTGGLTACGYIRLLLPLDHPTTAAAFDIILADAETIFDHHADIIITQRHAIADEATAARLTDHAARTSAKLLYDLDDDLLDIPDIHPDARALQPFAGTVRRMLTAADAVWVSTQPLADRLAPIRPDATVIENRLDERLWCAAPAPFWDDPVRILCMGTSSHDRDFALIEPVLTRLKADYGDRVEIDVLGMTIRGALPEELNRIGPSTHASRSYPGFVNWLTTVRPRWHIGLAPLLDTPFNRSKSPLKAMDYAALGLTVLASDMPVYRGSIADGPAGQLVANDPAAWHAALDWLIRDQDRRERGTIEARQAFVAQSTLASDPTPRLTALTRLLSAPPQRTG